MWWSGRGFSTAELLWLTLSGQRSILMQLDHEPSPVVTRQCCIDPSCQLYTIDVFLMHQHDAPMLVNELPISAASVHTDDKLWWSLEASCHQLMVKHGILQPAFNAGRTCYWVTICTWWDCKVFFFVSWKMRFTVCPVSSSWKIQLDAYQAYHLLPYTFSMIKECNPG